MRYENHNSPTVEIQSKDSLFSEQGQKSNIKTLEELSKAIDNEIRSAHNEFPVEVFPKALQRLIASAKETRGYNESYLSAGILSACATAIGNSVTLDNGSYTSRTILWIAVIGSRGTGKTHPLSFAKTPIEEKDIQSYTEYRIKMQEYEQQEGGIKPRYAKFILSDFTPEKLAEALQYSAKGVLIFNDELMRWVNSFDQYKKGGDQQMYLDLFNGGILTVDRVSKDPILVECTNVNILGGMQPEIVKQLAKNNRGDDGFLDRFLFVYPENLQPHLYTGLDIPDEHKKEYTDIVNNLLTCPKQELTVSNDCIELYKKWQHEKAWEYFKDTLERSIQAKLETYVWRLALVIEMMQQAVTAEYSTEITRASLDDALRLVEYFRHNALKVHDKIMSRNPLDDLTPHQVNLYEDLPEEFKRADVADLFDEHNVKGGSVTRFLNKGELFEKMKHGHYKKKI